jgi:hypothetical protein
VSGTKKTPTDVTDVENPQLQELIGKLQGLKTSAELWRVASTDEFRAAVNDLGEAQQDILRETFKAFDVQLKGKVSAEDVAGIPLVIDDWDYPQQDKYPNSTFLVLKGVRSDTGERFEWAGSSTRIVRHFDKLDPIKDSPQHIMWIRETPAQMTARNAAVGTSPMWLVKRLGVGAARPANSKGGSPF